MRTDRLQKKLRVSLVETGKLIGVSKAMLFAYRSGTSPISDKVWKKLEEAETRHGLDVYPDKTDQGKSAFRVEESPQGARPDAPAFREYLLMLRGLREEAEKLAGGNLDRAAEIFERMLDTWTKTLAAAPLRQPSESELTLAATAKKIEDVKAFLAAQDEEARQESEQKHG